MTRLKNCLIISLGSCRPRDLSSYPRPFPVAPFSARARTPIIDGLTRRGHRFDQAMTAAAQPYAACASLISGVLPSRHGVVTPAASLARGVMTVADRLAQAGLRTALFSGDTSVSLGAYFQHVGIAKLPHESVANVASDWIARLPRGDKFAAFVQLSAETIPPSIFPSRARQLRLSRIDAAIGRLLRAVEQHEAQDETLIIVTAANGRVTNEASIRHMLNDSALHVPLIMFPQIGNRATIPEQVSTLDLFPTILQALEIENSAETDGTSLIGLLSRQPQASEDNRLRNAYAEISDRGNHLVVLRSPPFKLVWNRTHNYLTFYNLERDRAERIDVSADYADLLATLQSELRTLNIAQLPSAQPTPAVSHRRPVLGTLKVAS